MYHIAIVEDEKEFSALLVAYLEQYKKEHGVELQVSVFSDGESILKDYKPVYDAVEALDFVMKPVDYYVFAMKVGRVLKRVQKKERHHA